MVSIQWKNKERDQYAAIGHRIVRVLSEIQEKSCGRGLSVYAGRGGVSFNIDIIVRFAMMLRKNYKEGR